MASPFINIDVGGKSFKLFRNTIMKYPKSTLARVVSGQDQESAVMDQGVYFFDRNPDYFTPLADYMRTGKVILTANVSKEMFASEAEFWGLKEALTPPTNQDPVSAQKPIPAAFESTVSLQDKIGPTLLVDPDPPRPQYNMPNGYNTSFNPKNQGSVAVKTISSEGSLASSTTLPDAPQTGNLLGRLELKKSIETTQTLKRKDEPLTQEMHPSKKPKFKPRTCPSDMEIEKAYKEMQENELEDRPVINVTPPVVAILSGFELNDRNSITEKVTKLNGRVIDSFDDHPTHLILTEFKNTKKLLIALNKGLEVVSGLWVHASIKAGNWLPTDRFFVCTPEIERKHGFRYSETLRKARSGGFLRDKVFYISPVVRPSSHDFEEVVMTAGGKFIPKRPPVPVPNLYVIAEANSKEAEEMKGSGFNVKNTDWLCDCVFQQQILP